MKFPKTNNHGISDKLFKHIPDKLRQYASNMFNSLKCKNMSHGASDVVRMMTCARGNEWRRNHCKTLKKHHK